jgi:hypothetical protein
MVARRRKLNDFAEGRSAGPAVSTRGPAFLKVAFPPP